jgi:hypothetical protein
MDVELVLAGSVWDWARQRCPNEPQVAKRAVGVAMNSYAGGASVAEACEEARAFVASWTSHPARWAGVARARLPVAS